jgi:acetylornithine deacetylase/succinyl-diaminopimelate desuccinylase-like protein
MKNTIYNRLEETLAQLVAIPSITSNSIACHEVLNFVRNQLEGLGLFITSDTDRDNPWLIATAMDTKEPDVMFAAHLDVVPAESELFTMLKQGGKLYGRGVYDMKLAAACYLELIKSHAYELRQRNIGFLFTTDEEIGSGCVPSILEMGWRPGIVFIPDGGDNWHVEEKAKGLYGIELVTHGKTAHGSRPWEGDNALHRIMDVIHHLRQLFPHERPNDATLAVNQMNGGRAVNQIADYAMAKLDFRSFHREDLKRFLFEVQRLAAMHNLEMSITQEGDPLLFDSSSSQARDFLAILERLTGEPPRFTKSFGASDGRYLAQYDIPCIIIEPRGGGRHSPDEWLLAEDLPKFYMLIKEWALSQKPVVI